MFAHGQLTRCLEHKASLLQQSAGHRRTLAAEAQPLRSAADWVDLGMAVTRKARASWLVLAPLIFLRRTRKRESTGFIHTVVQGISCARSLVALWRSWS